MLANQKLEKRFEADIKLVRRCFAEIISRLSRSEREENVRLRDQLKHGKRQLRLCRELARSLNY